MLLSPGNSKLGPGVYAFGIPAGKTCPGESPVCSSVCYAQRGLFLMPTVRAKMAANLAAARRPGFVRRIVEEIHLLNAAVVRWHVDGDFFSPSYARDCIKVFRRAPGTTFFTYTRSWRLPGYREVFERMAALANVRLWFSADSATGPPPRIPGLTGIAYLALNDGDVPGYPVELAFRDRPKTPMKKLGGAVVCPYEQKLPGAPATSCSKCRYCFSPRAKKLPAAGRFALSLPVVGTA